MHSLKIQITLNELSFFQLYSPHGECLFLFFLAMNDNFSITLDVPYLVDILKGVIKPGHEDLAQCIVGVVTGDRDREAIFKAALGIKPQINYAIGDVVYIDLAKCYVYDVDKQKTIEKFADKTGYIPCTVENIRPYHIESYNLTINVINSDGKEMNKCITVKDKEIMGTFAEDFPDEETKF